MKAVILTTYGPPDGLQLTELDTPVPGPGEVLVRVQATTVTAGDAEIRASNLPWLFWIPIRIWLGLFRPRANMVLGMELAGVIEAVGTGVEHYAVGDAIFATPDLGFGTHAEYVSLDVSGVVARAPAGVPLEQLAPLPIAGLAALGYLRKGGIEAGQDVLIRGASGSIGTYAVQLAKHHGAHVTAVCAPQSVDRMAELGADVVIDYTQTDITQSSASYDLMLDVVGKIPISQCTRLLKPSGAYVRGTVPGLWEFLQAAWMAIASPKRVVLGDAGASAEDLAFLGDLVASGELVSVIDRRYPLDQIADAHRYVDTGDKQGHVLITS